jgi:hypothetical protein
MGRQAGEEVESKQSKLANLIRGQQSAEIDKFVSAENPQERLKLSLSSQNPALQGIGAKIAENEFVAQKPEWKESKKYNPDGTITHGYINIKSQEPLKTFVEGSVQPALTAYEKSTIQRKEFEWENLSAKDKLTLANDAARLNMSAKEFFFNTGMSVGGAPSAPFQTQPIAPQPPQASPQGLSNALRGQPTQAPPQAPVMPQQPQAQLLNRPPMIAPQAPQNISGQAVLPPKMQLELLKNQLNPNIPESATGQITGVENVKSALGDLKTRIETFKKTDMINPNSRALMNTDYQNVMLQLKEAMKLGVLNGNDYQILSSMIVNPNSAEGAIVNKNTKLEQITNLEKKLNDMTSNVYKTHQKNVPANLAPTSVQNDLISQARAELERRKGK